VHEKPSDGEIIDVGKALAGVIKETYQLEWRYIPKVVLPRLRERARRAAPARPVAARPVHHPPPPPPAAASPESPESPRSGELNPVSATVVAAEAEDTEDGELEVVE
jgi:hypothetical protein